MSDNRSENLGYFSQSAAKANPDATAIFDLSRDPVRTVTYAEMEERHDRLAAMLTARGLDPGDHFLLAVSNRFEFVEIMYGAMRAGLVPVPLNIKLGAETIRFILEDSGCKAAIIEPSANRFVAETVDANGIDIKIAFDPAPEGWEDYETALQAAASTFTPPLLEPNHPSFQPYTSGSTGKPKGVVLTHSGQLWWIRAVEKYWPSRRVGRALTAMPLYHKNAMAGAIKPMFCAGGSVVLLPRFEPVSVLKALSEYKCTRTGGVPAAFSLMLRHKALIRSLDFSALQSITIGSAPVSEELAEQIEEAFGVAVGESYGLTEGGPVMIGPPLDGRKPPFGSCGVAWPEGEVKLVAVDGADDVDFGELWVRNPGVTPGYHNRPDVNAERLVDGWLKTGDLFFRDNDGFFFFKGRVDDMFNSGGENIYPKEVENLLLSHEAVADACVVPIPHVVKGMVPVALVMLVQNGAADEVRLKAHCLDQGPAYAHPRRIEIVDQIPLNGAGKNDRSAVQRELTERFNALGAD